ncbi:hypothetical protein FB107DRAFT_268554 [Schizophyllum commune]
MSAQTTIHINGVTGYIGGTVLARLLEHPKRSTFRITALLRDAKKAEKLKADFGVEPIVGSLDDVDLIEKAASEADIIIPTADCDHEPSCNAILRGAKKRFETTGRRPAIINTSGTSAIAVDTNGLQASETIYDDANAEQMASLPITNLHRVVDTTLIAADAEGGYTYTYILMPATIWGHADHALTRAGIANHRSIQMPNVIAGSLLRGRPGVWGKGAGIWTSVEIGELGDLYMLLVDAVLRDPASIPHGREGYYFGATEEHSWYEASRAIGEAMVALGKTDNPEPTSFTDEEIAKWYKGYDLCSNARARPTHATALGWKPKQKKAEFLASLRHEVEGCIEKPFPLKPIRP